MQEQNSSSTRKRQDYALAQKFVREADAVIDAFPSARQVELTEHLLSTLDFIEQYAEAGDNEVYKKYAASEDALLKRYGRLLKDYSAKGFHHYFDFHTVLVEKGAISSEEYNSLSSLEEQKLRPDEIRGFLQMSRNALNVKRRWLLLDRAPEDPQIRSLEEKGIEASLLSSPNESSGKAEKDAGEQEAEESEQSDKIITQARQLLSIYYFLKSFGIEARDTASVSAVAQFIHLLTRTTYTSLQNSEIYKKYRQMPNYKKDAQLLEDLKFIRPYFERLQIEEAIKLIDEETARATRELPYAQRKRLKGD